MSWWLGLGRVEFTVELGKRSLNKAERTRGVNFYSMDWGEWGAENLEKRRARSKRATRGWQNRLAEKGGNK